MLEGMYGERRAGIPGAVVWWRRADDSPDAATRVLPDGCMDLIWMGGDLVVAGPDTVAHVMGEDAGRPYTGIRFPPGLGPAVFGVPAVELRDSRVPLAELWGGSARDLVERMGESEDPGSLLERVAARRLRDAEPDPVAAMVADGLGAAEVWRTSRNGPGSATGSCTGAASPRSGTAPRRSAVCSASAAPSNWRVGEVGSPTSRR